MMRDNPRTTNTLRSYRIALILMVLGAILVLAQDINAPLVGGYQSYSTLYGLIAKNYLRYGYLTPHFGWVVNADQVSPEQFIYYTRHPPFFGILLSLGMHIFGDEEWALRLVPIFFSVGNLLLIFLIAKELWGPSLGIKACLFAILSPIYFAYGSHLDHVGPPLLFFMQATFLFYIFWIKRLKNCYFFWMCLSFSLAALTGWPAYFLVPCLLIHHLWTKRSILIWILPALAILIFSFFLLHNYLLTGDEGVRQLKEMLLYRLRISTLHPTWTEMGYPLLAKPGSDFSLIDWMRRVSFRMTIFLSPFLLVFSCLWVFSFMAKVIRRKKEIQADSLLLVYMIGFSAYCLVFSNITYNHDYVLLCLWGPVAISSALGFQVMADRLRGSRVTLPLTAAVRLAYGGVCILLLIQSLFVVHRLHLKHTQSLWEYDLGKAIMKRIPSGEEAMTSSKVSFAARYYADRFIWFEVRDLETFKTLKGDLRRNYTSFVVREGDPIQEELLGFLKNNYDSHQENGFIFFKLRFSSAQFLP